MPLMKGVLRLWRYVGFVNENYVNLVGWFEGLIEMMKKTCRYENLRTEILHQTSDDLKRKENYIFIGWKLPN